MNVQVKEKLTKTTECKHLDLRNKQGYCVQVLGDGYCLIEFDKTVRRKYKTRKLQWYVHENDFFIKL